MPHPDDLKPHYLSAGERALILRALQFLAHQQHQMIDEAYAKYKMKGRDADFEDRKADHQKQIGAINALHERFRSGDVFKSGKGVGHGKKRRPNEP